MKLYSQKAILYLSAITVLIIVYTFYGDVIKNKVISTGRDVLNTAIENTRRERIYSPENNKHVRTQTETNIKYILQWTSNKNVPFVDMGEGRAGFIDRKCPHTNCFVTSNRSLLSDYTQFDVVAFSGPELFQPAVYGIEVPKRRSPHQKYVFASIESSHYYPACTEIYDGFFNWTWTYRLDSEVQWGYIVIRDLHKNIIGPGKNIKWLKLNEMAPVSEEFKKQLSTKQKAAAMFASNCVTMSARGKFTRELQMELSKYNLDVDIYGKCGIFDCSRDHENECNKKIERQYYFYLSFENAFSEDYVTEKLLRALQNNVVPIVYGGADYSRFLPEGAYLDALKLGVVTLAAKMKALIDNPDKYADFFRWKNHYTYHQTSESVYTNEYCQFCALLNNDSAVKQTSVYQNFREWWDAPEACEPHF